MSRDRTAVQWANRLLARAATRSFRRAKARVAGVAADVAGVDLLDDDGDLVEPEAVVEEHAGHVAAGLLGVAVDQLPAGQAAGQGRRPERARCSGSGSPASTQ